MKHRRAATSYAKALFAVAKEQNQTEVVSRELGAIAAMFEGDEKLRDVFARPWIPPPARRAVAAEIAQRSNLSKLSSDFVACWMEVSRGSSSGCVVASRVARGHAGRVRAVCPRRIRQATPK
jgi:F0F1-type ATP synthase delta subunit